MRQDSLGVRPPVSLTAGGPDADQDHDLRSIVTVCRTHPSDCGQRQIYVWLDDRYRFVLPFGQSATIDLPPGAHRLRVHSTLFRKTIDFTIETGERLEFFVINTARWWTYGMAGLLGAAPLFLTVRKSSVLQRDRSVTIRRLRSDA